MKLLYLHDGKHEIDKIAFDMGFDVVSYHIDRTYVLQEYLPAKHTRLHPMKPLRLCLNFAKQQLHYLSDVLLIFFFSFFVEILLE